MNNIGMNFVIIDDVIDGLDNVVFVIFKDNEVFYFVGIVVVYMIEMNVVGFIGGVKGEVIDCFDVGFKVGVDVGVKELGKEIKVLN